MKAAPRPREPHPCCGLIVSCLDEACVDDAPRACTGASGWWYDSGRPERRSRGRPLCCALRTQLGHRATSEKCQKRALGISVTFFPALRPSPVSILLRWALRRGRHFGWIEDAVSGSPQPGQYPDSHSTDAAPRPHPVSPDDFVHFQPARVGCFLRESSSKNLGSYPFVSDSSQSTMIDGTDKSS